MVFERVAIVGLGLLGGSLGLALGEHCPEIATSGFDADPDTRARAAERGLVGTVAGTLDEADVAGTEDS